MVPKRGLFPVQTKLINQAGAWGKTQFRYNTNLEDTFETDTLIQSGAYWPMFPSYPASILNITNVRENNLSDISYFRLCYKGHT